MATHITARNSDLIASGDVPLVPPPDRTQWVSYYDAQDRLGTTTDATTWTYDHVGFPYVAATNYHVLPKPSKVKVFSLNIEDLVNIEQIIQSWLDEDQTRELAFTTVIPPIGLTSQIKLMVWYN